MAGLRDGELETAREIADAVASDERVINEVLGRTKRRHSNWERHLNAFSQLGAGLTVGHVILEDLPDPSAWARVSQLRVTSPLRDIPVAVKDLFDVVGWVLDRVDGRYETTGCCAAYGIVPERDAEVIARIRRVGLLINGKTNQHELAAGGTNLVSACGRTCNPWDPARMTGGSSGGSAAAVAAGIVPWALGSDTGGSIRIPASMCGTYGLKPTTGQLPTHGMMPLAPSMDCPGPLAMTADDLWALYRIIRGEDHMVPCPTGERETPFRIGLLDGFFADRVHDETRAVVREVASTLEGAGAIVEPVDGHGIDDARRVWMRVCTPEFADALPDWRARADRIAPSVLDWLQKGDRLTAEEREQASERRQEIRAWFEQRLEGRDALLVPTTAYPAPRADQTHVDLGAAGVVAVEEVGPGYMSCTVNLANLPAMNVPAGWSSEGVPIGVSLVGHRDDEATLFAVASLWETATDYRIRRPSLPLSRSSPGSPD
jgi:Asp-tRNA(Asn)/Glu-tRNA(Gln) amidotransferase A subunit family amidase